MNDKYVKLADVKRKLRYIFKAYGVGGFVREKVERALNNLPYSIKGDLETTLEDTDVQPVNQWISVDDKLPDTVYDCLVWYSCDTAFGKSKSVGISFCSRCDWYKKHLNGDNIVVLYWMPLPEPPKDGDTNG